MKTKQNKTERKMIKDFKKILKDFEPMVKNPKFLWNGRDIENFTLRPREAWANWLLCIVLRYIHGESITFVEDKEGDGIILHRESGRWILTEHVSALDIPKGRILPKGEDRIIDAINHKIKKGLDYAKNKNLVVFFDGAGEFYRNKIREGIKGRHGFDAVYCIGLLISSEDGYSYIVTEFREIYGDKSLSYQVKINNDFTSWEVTQIMA